MHLDKRYATKMHLDKIFLAAIFIAIVYYWSLQASFHFISMQYVVEFEKSFDERLLYICYFAFFL